MIVNAIAGEKLPIYGDGGNIRDWLFVCADKLAHELGFRAETALADGLRRTVDWYLDNEGWWRAIR